MIRSLAAIALLTVLAGLTSVVLAVALRGLVWCLRRLLEAFP